MSVAHSEGERLDSRRTRANSEMQIFLTAMGTASSLENVAVNINNMDMFIDVQLLEDSLVVSSQRKFYEEKAFEDQ